MKKKIIIAHVSLLLVLFISNIVLTVQHLRLRSKFTVATSEFSRQLSEHLQYINSKVEDIENDVHLLSDSQSRDAAEIQGKLASIKRKTDAQFSETVGIKETYDNILGELKKKTVDTTSQDTAMLQTKKNAEKYYSEKNFALAYREFKKVLSYQYDDIECRLKKMKSLYYMNRADSSKYSEILEDINILKNSGYADEETVQIEALITAEREGVNE